MRLTSLTAETHLLPCVFLLHFYNVIRTNNCALFMCSEILYCFPLTSLRTCLPFCTIIFVEHSTSFTAMLDANVGRERRIRALVVVISRRRPRIRYGRKRKCQVEYCRQKYIYVYSGINVYFIYK